MSDINSIKKQILAILKLDGISLEQDKALTELLQTGDKKLIDATSKDFVEYCRQHVYTGEHDRKFLYNKFVNLYPASFWNVSPHKFTRWLKIYGQFAFTSVRERKSHGRYFITFE